jgi:hypothetical protein
MKPAIPAILPHSARVIERAMRCLRDGVAPAPGVGEEDVVVAMGTLLSAG